MARFHVLLPDNLFHVEAESEQEAKERAIERAKLSLSVDDFIVWWDPENLDDPPPIVSD